MSGPRALSIRRVWWLAPILAIALLLVVRALVHTPQLDALARAPADASDPPGTVAYTGSLAVTRGGPVFIGFQSDAPARLQFAGHEVRGRGLVTRRFVVPHGPTALRFAAPPGARLVWSPVGRRGDPEYIPASSLSPEPPERATFDAPGTARADGVIALAILVVIVATLCVLARRRLATVPRATWLAMAAVFAVGLVIRLVDLGAAGQTWDEDVNWAAGRNYITNLLALDVDARSWIWNYEHPPVMKYLAGIGAQLADGFGPARAISSILVALGCALLVPIGARLYRLRVGVLAAGIATLLPTFLAHSHVVGHEAPTILWWSLGVLLALGVHDDLPDDARAARRTLLVRLAAVGAVVGVAIASRFVNGLLGPLCAVIVVVQAPPAWRRTTLTWGALVMPLAAVATFYVLWPRIWAHPIASLSASFDKLDVKHSLEPFLGATTNAPGPHYFLVYLVAVLPLGVLLAAAAGLVRAARERDKSALLVAAWLLVPLGAMASPVRQDGVRYVLPCFAAIAVIAAAGIDFIAHHLERRVSRAFVVLAAVFAGYLGITAARAHPYYLDYFGEHTGGAGTVAARRWFETAWWGEGLDRAVAYVNAHAAPNARVYRDCIEPRHLAWFREDLWQTMAHSPQDAAWIVVYSPAQRRCPLPRDARKVFEVVHDGVTLAAVYRR